MVDDVAHRSVGNTSTRGRGMEEEERGGEEEGSDGGWWAYGCRLGSRPAMLFVRVRSVRKVLVCV